MTVMAAAAYRSNAELIEAVVELGHLSPTDKVLDPTYGRGIWWNKWAPNLLICTDKALNGMDFTAMPWDDESYDAVAFDPPYVCKGGRATSGIMGMDERYGLVDAPGTPAELQQLINAGVRECTRVLRPKGKLLVKCQDYVSSGKVWWGTDETRKVAVEELGLRQLDRLTMVGHVRPQPPGRRQVHARNNASVLFIFQKP